jgi:FkbM family methyltransferase
MICHRFTIFQAAITDHNGMVKMAMADAHSMTRMVSGTEIDNKDLTQTRYNKGEIQVQGYELRALIAKLNYSRIDLMKIDIEGAEMQVIATIDKWQNTFRLF